MDNETYQALANARIERAKELLDKAECSEQVSIAKKVYEKAREFLKTT